MKTITRISVGQRLAENSLEPSTINKPYLDWRDAVDGRLHQIYYITVEDAGIYEECLVEHWQSNEAPLDFVEWFGNKYDLDPISSFFLPQERSR